jgi:short-subunit dehydrogenase
MTPEKVVDASFKNLRKGKVVCVPGFWNKVIWLLADILPRGLYYKLVSLAEKKEHKFIPSKKINELIKMNLSLSD